MNCVSNLQLDILYYIYRHPYCSIEQMLERFSTYPRWSHSYPFRIRKAPQGTFVKERFTNELEYLRAQGLICATPYSVKNRKNDCGTLFSNETPLDSNVCFLLTESGCGLIDQDRKNRFLLWVPWAVTAFIAGIDTVFNILNFLRGC